MEKNLVAVLGNVSAEEFELAVKAIARKRKSDEFYEKERIAKEILDSAADAIRELGLTVTIPNGYYRIDDEFKITSIKVRKPWAIY